MMTWERCKQTNKRVNKDDHMGERCKLAVSLPLLDQQQLKSQKRLRLCRPVTENPNQNIQTHTYEYVDI